ncbi:MAG: heme ABC transporter ATP-binding protein [Pseudomonadota bacterium]
MSLSLENITVLRSGRSILDDVTINCQPGQFTAFCGPNGAGKTTALRTMSGLLPPDKGTAKLDDISISRMGALKLARRRGFVAQSATLSFPFRVHEVIEMGRTPHFGVSTQAEDAEAVTQAMALMAVDQMAERDYLTLSGGERQRVMIARALAQIWYEPSDGDRWLLLDEPTSALDLKYQLKLIALVRKLADSGWGVIAVLHDLELVRRAANRVILFKDGQVKSDGHPTDKLTPNTITDIFDLDEPYTG